MYCINSSNFISLIIISLFGTCRLLMINCERSVSGAGAPACRQAGIAKNVTNQMTFIVRVSLCFILFKINIILCPEVFYKSPFEIRDFLYDIDRKCHKKCLGVALKNQWSFAGYIIISHLLF